MLTSLVLACADSCPDFAVISDSQPPSAAVSSTAPGAAVHSSRHQQQGAVCSRSCYAVAPLHAAAAPGSSLAADILFVSAPITNAK